MENEYLDSYERAKRADRERRSHARQMKRRRQKRLKMIKGAITAAVAVVVAVCCILYTTAAKAVVRQMALIHSRWRRMPCRHWHRFQNRNRNSNIRPSVKIIKKSFRKKSKVRMLHYST